MIKRSSNCYIVYYNQYWKQQEIQKIETIIRQLIFFPFILIVWFVLTSSALSITYLGYDEYFAEQTISFHARKTKQLELIHL